ncbi:MAG: lipoyl(octanoyl) transferase LipB [Betaproteobacteria bacterium]|nr:lipoyl(octanoyl) transferase LipB [Betaproteobacteria bacterium]
MTVTLNRAQEPVRLEELEPRVRHLGVADYETTWRAMQSFTTGRGADTQDEIWVLEHPSVYTLGVAGKAEHLPRVANGIPVVKVDRGGQITYHGPGQVVAYLLLDLRRRGLGVRTLVRQMERAVIDLLHTYAIEAAGRTDAPGVYVNDAKVAALGLRIKNGCCYHGLALNVDMDLAPFHAINPCGYPGLAVTQLRDLGIRAPGEAVREQLVAHLTRVLR